VWSEQRATITRWCAKPAAGRKNNGKKRLFTSDTPDFHDMHIVGNLLTKPLFSDWWAMKANHPTTEKEPHFGSVILAPLLALSLGVSGCSDSWASLNTIQLAVTIVIFLIFVMMFAANRRRTREEIERRVREAEFRAREEVQRKLWEAEQKAREEAENRAKEEAEQRALEETARRAREDEERLAREEELRRSQEEAERRAREQVMQQAQEEAERKAREEAERRVQAEIERKARAEAERRVKAAAQRPQLVDAEREAHEARQRELRDVARRRALVEARHKAQAQRSVPQPPQSPRPPVGQAAPPLADRQSREESVRLAREEALRRVQEDFKQRTRKPAQQAPQPPSQISEVSGTLELLKGPECLVEPGQPMVKILLAEDSVTMRAIFNMVLAGENCDLTVVDSGKNAVTQAKEIIPDLVIADLSMDDFNGYEVCSALKSDSVLADIPVLLLHGASSIFDEAKAQNVGAAGDIVKPFLSQTLIGALKKHLQARP